ncbi:hypothetical protein [Nocardia sp. NPDC057030]|uniref:hypothetical protein n=1 Tax=unclassified Nocardia TaxID=2637762 RepID=UPI00362CB623
MSRYVCDHCGRDAGDDAGGYSSLHDVTGSYRFCHPPVSGRPDCYRLVTEDGEVIGGRRPCRVCSLPDGQHKLSCPVGGGPGMRVPATIDAAGVITVSGAGSRTKGPNQ